MRALVIAEPDPPGDDPTGTLQTLEVMTVHALLLLRPGDAFDHSALFRTEQCDEFVL